MTRGVLADAPRLVDDAGRHFYDERLLPLLDQVRTSIESATSGWAFEGGDRSS